MPPIVGIAPSSPDHGRARTSAARATHAATVRSAAQQIFGRCGTTGIRRYASVPVRAASQARQMPKPDAAWEKSEVAFRNADAVAGRDGNIGAQRPCHLAARIRRPHISRALIRAVRVAAGERDRITDRQSGHVRELPRLLDLAANIDRTISRNLHIDVRIGQHGPVEMFRDRAFKLCRRETRRMDAPGKWNGDRAAAVNRVHAGGVRLAVDLQANLVIRPQHVCARADCRNRRRRRQLNAGRGSGIRIVVAACKLYRRKERHRTQYVTNRALPDTNTHTYLPESRSEFATRPERQNRILVQSTNKKYVSRAELRRHLPQLSISASLYQRVTIFRAIATLLSEARLDRGIPRRCSAIIFPNDPLTSPNKCDSRDLGRSTGVMARAIAGHAETSSARSRRAWR